MLPAVRRFPQGAGGRRVHGRPPARSRSVRQGQVVEGAGAKFDEHAVAKKETFEQRTLYMIARDPKAKQYAAKAERIAALTLDVAEVLVAEADRVWRLNEQGDNIAAVTHPQR